MAGQLTTSPYNPGYAPTQAVPRPGPGQQADWFTANAPQPTTNDANTPGTEAYALAHQGPQGSGPVGNQPTSRPAVPDNPSSRGPGSDANYTDPKQMILALLKQGIMGQQAADQVNAKFPGSVNWRADRNFFDFPATNSYIHQADQGGWAGDWEIVERGPEGSSSNNPGGGVQIDPATLAQLNGIGPFKYTGGDQTTLNYTGPGQQDFTPTTKPFEVTPFVAPESKPEPGKFVAPTLSETNDPGYLFRMEQTQDAVEKSAAARGTLLTTGTLSDTIKNVGNQASAEYANVWQRAFDEQTAAYSQWLSSDQNTFGKALNTNQTNNQFGLAANANAFNQEYTTNQANNNAHATLFNQAATTTQINNAANANTFNQQLQQHQTNYNDIYNLANLGYNASNSSFS